MKKFFNYLLYVILLIIAVVVLFIEWDRQETNKENQYKEHYEMIDKQFHE